MNRRELIVVIVAGVIVIVVILVGTDPDNNELYPGELSSCTANSNSD